MDRPRQLIERLEAIGRSLAESGQALALIGLGSAGAERARLDTYSDLDFFVVAADGAKHALVDDLGWMSAAAPIAYHVRNTADGYKLLFADGIFCEFAVFERAELQTIPFTAAQLVWKAPGVADDIAVPVGNPQSHAPPSVEWLLGEILTNIYVGLGRYRRGERLSAARFIQGYAVDRLLDLAPSVEAEQPAFADPFGAERRFEQRFPATAAALPSFMQGYSRSPESALALLAWLEQRFAIDPAMAAAIRDLA